MLRYIFKRIRNICKFKKIEKKMGETCSACAAATIENEKNGEIKVNSN